MAFIAQKKSLEYWKQVIHDCKSSGLDTRKWCEEHNIKYNTYRSWFTKIRNQKVETNEPVWAEISLPQKENLAENSKLTIHYGDFSLEVENNSDMDLLTKVLKTLSLIC